MWRPSVLSGGMLIRRYNFCTVCFTDLNVPWNGEHTRMRDHRSLTLKEEIDGLLLALDIPANIIHDFYQADVCLDKRILSLIIQRFALSCDTVSGFL